MPRRLSSSNTTLLEINYQLTSLIPPNNFEQNKLCGPEKAVWVDEAMLNFKVKNHSGSSANSRKEPLCIIE